MKKIHLGHVFVGLCLLILGVDIGLDIRHALASRNSSGTMSTLNTFVSGTTISSTNVNANFADIATEITDSLDRSGKGPMLAPLRLTNGTFAAPSLTFDSDTDTGIYRIGANNLGVTANGAKVLDVATTGLGVTGTLSASGDVTASTKLGIGGAPTNSLDVTLGGSGSTVVGEWLEASLADGNTVTWRMGKSDTSGGDGIMVYTKNATAANSTLCLWVFGQSNTLCVDGNGKVIIGGGTGISASYRGTTSWTPGSITANACATTTISLTGAAAGADCTVTPPSGVPVASVWTSCSVTLNTCNLYQCNADNVNAHTGDSGTYACRVFNP
jgi:hypothetical protein